MAGEADDTWDDSAAGAPLAADEACGDEAEVECTSPDGVGDEAPLSGAVEAAGPAAESGGTAVDPGDDAAEFGAGCSGCDGDEMPSLRVSGADGLGDEAGVVGGGAEDDEDVMEAGAADDDAGVEGGGDAFRGGQ